jgi:hypothetical protein
MKTRATAKQTNSKTITPKSRFADRFFSRFDFSGRFPVVEWG